MWHDWSSDGAWHAWSSGGPHAVVGEAHFVAGEADTKEPVMLPSAALADEINRRRRLHGLRADEAVARVCLVWEPA